MDHELTDKDNHNHHQRPKGQQGHPQPPGPVQSNKLGSLPAPPADSIVSQAASEKSAVIAAVADVAAAIQKLSIGKAASKQAAVTSQQQGTAFGNLKQGELWCTAQISFICTIVALRSRSTRFWHNVPIPSVPSYGPVSRARHSSQHICNIAASLSQGKIM